MILESAQSRADLCAAMLDAWITDLRGDGFSEEQIARRVRRGEPLRNAPLIVVPCLIPKGLHRYPDERRSRAEQEMFLISMGAAVQNFMVALAVEGLGSCYISSTLFCPDVAARCHRPAVRLPPDGGHRHRAPAAAPAPRPPATPD